MIIFEWNYIHVRMEYLQLSSVQNSGWLMISSEKIYSPIFVADDHSPLWDFRKKTNQYNGMIE